MARYIHRPDCYLANERGMVEVNDEYYMWLSFHNGEDKRMMNGNEPVSLRFISDSMEPTRHMANGRMYTSKKKFRDETRARGCIEVGNEEKYLTNTGSTIGQKKKVVKLDKRQRRDDIKRAIWEVKNGRDIMKEMRQDMAKKD